MTTPGPVTTGRWISQSSARDNLGLLRRGEMAELRKVGTVRDVEAGTVVAAAGSPATHVQIVGDGELELMARQDGGRTTMAVIRSGGVIQDIPMLLGNPVPFDAVASRDTEMIALSRQRWTELLASSPSLSMRWMTSIARRLDDDRRGRHQQAPRRQVATSCSTSRRRTRRDGRWSASATRRCRTCWARDGSPSRSLA